MFWFLVVLVALAPLPFASVYPWSWALMASLVGIMLIAWAVEGAVKGQRPTVGLKSIWPMALLFSTVIVWAFIQASTSTPGAWHHPLWQLAGQTLGQDLQGSVSLNPVITRSALLRLLAYGGVFWLSLQYCRSAVRAEQVMYSLAVVGLLYSAYGLVVEFSGAKMILWEAKIAYQDDLTSTFINRNSYATYAGLTLICASGLLLKMASESVRTNLGGREKLRLLIEAVSERGWILVVAWFAIVVAILLTHSRAGFASVVLALVTLCLAFGFTREMKLRYAFLATAVVIVAGISFFALSGEVTDQRLARVINDQVGRVKIYELTMRAIETAPVLGTGYGTFDEVFRFFRTEDLQRFILRGHNTYLENALELGIPVATALFASIGGLWLITLLGIRRRRRDAIYPCIGFAATILVAVHSTVDFSLQMPAVAVTYSLIMGAATAQSWSSRETMG